MSHFVTTHLYNVPQGREADYAAWFDGHHAADLARLSALTLADRWEVTPEQIMPDIAQPWRFMTRYEWETDTPEIDLPMLGALLADARTAGLIAAKNDCERIYSYAMYHDDWVSGPNHQTDRPLSSMFIIPANFVAGMEAEYHHWYDNVHMPEVSRVPGFVAMKRGCLSDVQIEPKRYCPGGEIVMCAHQTSDLLFSIKDFSARARGVSPSGDQMEPRSKAGSFARTVHFFRKISGEQWDSGIAYAGDLSLYPADFRETGA